MCLDWKETTEAHFLKMELPGMKKEEVKVDMDDASHVLTISGKKIREEKKEGDTWHIEEIRSGKFSRSFEIPKNAKVDEIKASMVDGVLNVTIPKVEARRSIQVSD